MIRKMWKPLVLMIAVTANFFPNLVQANDTIYSNQVTVLVYHHIDDEQQSGVTISTKLFSDQLRALKRKGYQFITMDQFKRFMSKGASVPDNAVLVTFDDGYRSFYTNAYPVLKRMDIPAVNFVITKDLDDPLHSSIPSLSNEEIAQIRREDPDIEFQAHSDSLHAMKDGKPMLTNKMMRGERIETDAEFEQRVLDDTTKCIRKLSDLKGAKAVDAYAYPFGSYDDQTMELLKQAGIQYSFTTKTGMASRHTDPMQIPRINAGSPYVRAHSVNNLIRHQVELEAIN
ncbi:polysaccharide deacetylase family protein [Paenibacillus aestuarii]|uniref:Polysaccharide deacetylase family protein n=1 Tax=Paenibacillus aestuarii TaxID=516965 RepID=A0ABW0K5J0_9BACL|nr:polysaccharide deacetylase family protein [Paenibacillus aestuarii]